MKLISSDLFDALVAGAGMSPRLRTNYNIHESLSDPVQRLFIAARLNSYFRPHRHPDKWELALVVRGLFDLILFDTAGRVTERVSLGPGANTLGFELPPNTWHSWVTITDGSVFFEIKQGPYDAQTIAEFAEWSPEEGTPQAQKFAELLRNAGVGDLLALS